MNSEDPKKNHSKWGDTGKKYYFQGKNKKSQALAKRRANNQGRAIYSTGWREK